jgi:hypothetical protein
MRWGNCWTYAVPRFIRRGGALVITGSLWSWVWHVRHAEPGALDGVEISEFVPLKPHRDWFNRTFPFYSICFRGRTRRGRLKGITTEEHQP